MGEKAKEEGGSKVATIAIGRDGHGSSSDTDSSLDILGDINDLIMQRREQNTKAKDVAEGGLPAHPPASVSSDSLFSGISSSSRVASSPRAQPNATFSPTLPPDGAAGPHGHGAEGFSLASAAPRPPVQAQEVPSQQTQPLSRPPHVPSSDASPQLQPQQQPQPRPLQAPSLSLVSSSASASGLLTRQLAPSAAPQPHSHLPSCPDPSLLPLAAAAGGSVPEFLYQLTRMLTDGTNRAVIAWTARDGRGRIEVRHPARLQSEVLGRYFRHSKYSSFQRQLNYFGFRKIAGKGRMSPCSYINERATEDIGSLLLMKRRNSAKEGGEGKATKKRPSEAPSTSSAAAVAVSAPSDSSSASEGAAAASASSAAIKSRGSEVFRDTAAVIAQNVASADPGGSNFTSSKRRKPSRVSPSSSIAAGGYQCKVASRGGVRHPLNGYLRCGSDNSTMSSHSNAAAPAAAPLRFLDPSELGMDVVDRPHRLRDDFAPPAPVDVISSTAATSQTARAERIGHAPSALTRRLPFCSSTAFAQGTQLRRDDSLVRLAMLPTLDGAPADSDAIMHAIPTAGGGDEAARLPKCDSLLNLAATVDAVEGGPTYAPAPVSDGGENFGFIEF